MIEKIRFTVVLKLYPNLHFSSSSPKKRQRSLIVKCFTINSEIIQLELLAITIIIIVQTPKSERKEEGERVTTE